MTQSLKQAKRQLRAQLKAKLKSISQDSLVKQSIEIHRKLLQHPKFQNAKSIAVFMNMPDSEIKTMKIIESCFELDKTVYLPKCNYKNLPGRKLNYLSMLEVPTFQDVLNLQPQGKFQLLEPISGNDVLDHGNLDVILLPGVAFTMSNLRMGHGAGFYDEFLTTYYQKFNKVPYLIGLCLEEQLLNDIPVEEHDWKMDLIID